jgi:hypothetical protein
LISPSSIGKKSYGSVYASLGAGAHLRGSEAVDEAYNIDETVASEKEKAAIVFARRTGIAEPKQGVINLGVSALLRLNEDNDRAKYVGLLGEALRKSGKKAAVFGNSDAGDWLKRPAAAIVMDEHGRAPYGDVSKRMLRHKPLSAAGWVTDTGRLLRSIDKAADQSDLIVVDYGDTARLDASRNELTIRAYEKYHKDTINNLDAFLGRVIALVKKTDGRLIFASFAPPYAPKTQWQNLTPVIAYGNGIAPGVFVSSTTRRPGLIAGIDIAPTLLHSVGVTPPEDMLGRVAEYKKTAETLTTLDRLDGTAKLSSRLQWSVLGAGAVFGGLVVTLATIAVALQIRLNRMLSFFLRVGMVLAFSFLGGLLFGGIGMPSASGIVKNVVLGTLLVFVSGSLIGLLLEKLASPASLARRAMPMVGVYVVIAGLVLADGLTGAHLLGACLASYQFTSGFRFYGIGNEYMGVLIGALSTAALWLSIKSKDGELSVGSRAVIVLVSAASAFILGWPGLGANAGGAVAAIVTFGLVYRAVSRRIFRPIEALILILVSIAVMMVFAFTDVKLGRSSSSHIGLAAGMLNRDSLSLALQMITRKILMNLSLIATKQSRMTIIGFIPFFALWFIYIQPRIRLMSERYRGLGPGLTAGMVGAAAAFIFNDSGIISASIMVASLVCCLLYSLLQEEVADAADNGS